MTEDRYFGQLMKLQFDWLMSIYIFMCTSSANLVYEYLIYYTNAKYLGFTGKAHFVNY